MSDVPAPASFANALFLITAMSCAGLVHVWWLQSAAARYFDQPLDGRRTFRRRRIFGDNKRLRGFIAMPLAAAAIFGWLGAARDWLPNWFAEGLWPLPPTDYLLLGLAAGFAFMLAELPNSFLKRQADVAPGTLPTSGWKRPVFLLLDRCDSVLGVLVAVSLLAPVKPMTWAWVLLLGPGVHAAFSALLYRVGVKARAL